MARLQTGEKPEKGSIITLCFGLLDQKERREWFVSDGNWECPQTVNGFWYDCESTKEIEREIANFI